MEEKTQMCSKRVRDEKWESQLQMKDCFLRQPNTKPKDT